MIILGEKKTGSVVSNILDKMDGRGNSHEDMKYDHERTPEGHDPQQALEHAAGMIMDAVRGDDIKKMEHSLKTFIQLCLSSKTQD